MSNAAIDDNRTRSLIGVSASGFALPTTVAVNPLTHAMLVEGSFSGGATSDNQTNGAQKTQIVDAGGEAATVTGGKLDVNASFSPSGTQDVNLTQVGGAGLALGQALATASLPVVLTAAQISTLTPLPTVAVTQSTSPWVVSGTVAFSNSTIAVTNAGTFATQESGTWIQVDDAAFTPATSKIAMIGAEFDDSSPDSVDEGDGGAIRMSGNRNLYVRIRDNAGNERGLNVDANGAIAVTATNATASNLKVAATLDAETTKVIGVTRTADGAGNLLTSNSTTYTAKFGLDNNLLGTLGTAFSTAGKVDIKAADGDVFVRSNAGSTFPVNATLQTQTDTVMVGGVNIKEINAVTPLMGAGATGTGALRIVQANDAGKTPVSTGGSAASNGNNTLVAAGTNRLKVYAFSLSTTSTTAVTCIFQSGASGTELWRVVLQAPTSVSTGANLAISPPAWLFATAAATLLNLNLSGAITVNWSVSYYDEA